MRKYLLIFTALPIFLGASMAGQSAFAQNSELAQELTMTIFVQNITPPKPTYKALNKI